MFNTKFNSVEVLEMAKDIEKRGQTFYENQAKKVDSEELKNLLLKLASDEKDHYNTFDKLVSEARKKTVDDVKYVYDEEVSAYLNALVEFTVFPAESEVEDKLNTVEDVLDLAITAEKDSILFYKEMIDYNQGETEKILKKLVEEEKQHLLDLVRYDAELG
ncbi:MAG: ferritin-like domain-containing protein [Halanaerobiales bacterium]